MSIVLAVFALSITAAWSATPANVAVIVKATDSDFWQSVLVGARNYGKENPDKAVIKIYGPKSESDIDRQVTILEDVIATKPHAIVIASSSPDATVPALESAKEAGIVVITIDSRVRTDMIDSFLATDNVEAGRQGARKFVEFMKAKNLPIKGKLAVVGSVAGIQSLVDREHGFTTTMQEIAPDIQLLGPRYCDNDIVKALSIATDFATANPELLGYFASNNHTGDGVARAISEMGLEQKLIGVAFDSDPEEIEAIHRGALKALIVQDPYGMGYKGVDYAIKKIAGEDIPAYVDTGVELVTKENIDTREMQDLLNPMSREK